MNPRPLLAGSLLAASFLAALGGCSSGDRTSGSRAQVSDTAYVASVEAWHAKRLASLRGEIGWLTIVGLHWLKPGDNVFGSDPTSPVPFPEGSSPPRAGVIRVDGTGEEAEITVKADPGVNLAVGDSAVSRRAFRLEHDGSSDRFVVGRVQFAVLERGGRYAVRVWDPESPLRKSFTGIPRYPVDPAYRVEGRLAPDTPMGKVPVPNIMGYVDTSLSPGLVTFALAGNEVALRPLIDAPADSELFFIFGDATTGKETYGGGRFLYATLEPGGRVTLDFNRAYNPPCALNPNTTCPLPPDGNTLTFPVLAGEKSLPDSAH